MDHLQRAELESYSLSSNPYRWLCSFQKLDGPRGSAQYVSIV